MRSLSYTIYPIVFLIIAGTTACGSDDSGKIRESPLKGPQVITSRGEDGIIVHKFDATGNGTVDVIKYMEEFPDPDDPAVTKRVMRKMEIDLNADGNINIRRYYSESGQISREELDLTLDGKINVINHFDHGQLTRKELVDADKDTVVATHHYTKGKLLRVEKDTNGDDKVDYWEFYEEGSLDRVGRDMTGDGRVDTWQQR